jgi:hypothetical protein
MALLTFGTNATGTLSAMQWLNKVSQQADSALVNVNIKDDVNVAHPAWPGAFPNDGILVFPNRGILRLLPGDWVGYGSTGWPILVSAAAKTADFTSA